MVLPPIVLGPFPSILWFPGFPGLEGPRAERQEGLAGIWGFREARSLRKIQAQCCTQTLLGLVGGSGVLGCEITRVVFLESCSF